MQMAAKDYDEDVVIEIIDHKYINKGKNKRDYEFLVRFVDD